MSWSEVRAKIIERLEQGLPEEAERIATAATPEDGYAGERAYLIGLAHFRREAYGDAVEALTDALKLEPGRAEWEDLCTMARSNFIADVATSVPAPEFHDRETLLAPPEVEPLPPVPRPLLAAKWPHRVRWLAGQVAGVVAGWCVGGLTRLWGRVSSYKDQVWTNWYARKVKILAILTLAHMREKLNAENLRSTYPDRALVGFQASGQPSPVGVSHCRTANGSWNNLTDPKEGAAGTRFSRNVGNRAIRRALDTHDLLDPNPRLASWRLLTRKDPMPQVPFLNLLSASWIQFQNHDWVSHGENALEAPILVDLPPDDPLRERYRLSQMQVARTQPDPTWSEKNCEATPLTFINEVTHWWDGSQIYGSDAATVARLRSHRHGKLEVVNGLLPMNGNVEDAGFRRNWWVGLTMLHTLFVHEHNAICDQLRIRYPHWSDERLFQVARLVNAAVMAKIHTIEWTPSILPNRVAVEALNANWYGLFTIWLRRGRERKTLAEINLRNPEAGGVVGNPINRHNSPYSLTQEFVEVYRLHSLLPETLHLRNMRSGQTTDRVPLAKTRQAGSRVLSTDMSMPDLFYSFGNQLPGQLVLNNYPRFLQELGVPGTAVLDLGAVDLLRARERGVPRYNDFREELGLNPIGSFEDLTPDPAEVAALTDVYGGGQKGVSKLDLLIGTLAERQRPTNFGFGETLFQIFILNATRRLQADRFYTNDFREEIYTQEGLHWIDRATLKSVLLRHYPELAETGLANVKNAFEPWDADETLDLSRHPLRSFDDDLNDPGRGDAFS